LNHVSDGGQDDPKGEEYFGVVGLIKTWKSLLRRFRQQKFNNCDSRTAAAGGKAPAEFHFHLILLYLSHVAAARSSSAGNMIHYILPVLWMTSFFHVTEELVRIDYDAYVSPSSPAGGTGGEVYRLRLHQVAKVSRCPLHCFS